MIRTLLVLELEPGVVDDAECYFRENLINERALGYGMLRGELVADEDASTMVSAAIWPDRSSYDRWQAAPERIQLVEGMLAFLVRPAGIRGSIEDLNSSRDELVDTTIDVSTVIGDDSGRTVTRLHCVISPRHLLRDPSD